MGCNIDKMLIKGIRSFSPDNANVIEFYKPLTLIVGHNGAGKTTIIECLKMSCTGELPPNTRSGQSFIHDPKVAGETEVKAQIKLRFLTSNRQPVVVVRSFQLTQKKSTMQFKALDNVLQTVNRDTGQKEALSYRCGDIDRIVPQLMGVSKAVLENVIFVHQEESNWPLAEGQVLKKKFDDIFAATKYTKALEALRKLRTEKAQEVKELKLKLDHTKTVKDQAAKLRAEVKQGNAQGKELQQQIAALDAEAQEASARRDELQAQLSKIADYSDDLIRLRTAHGAMARQNAEAYSRLLSNYPVEDVEMEEEELHQFAATLEPSLQTSEQNLRRTQRDLQSATIDLQATTDQYTQDLKKQGRLAAEADAHERNLAEIQSFLRDVCGQAGIQPADATASAAVAAFKQRLAEVAAQLESAKTANRAADDNMGKAIDQVSAELSGTSEAQRMKREQMQRNGAKAAELQAQFEHLIVNQAMLDGARDRQRDCEARLTAKQAQLAGSKYEEEARKLSARLGELAGKASQLRAERDTLAATAEGASRLRFKAQELSQKQSQLDGLLIGARVRLSSLFGAPELPATGELLGRVQGVVSQRQGELAVMDARVKEFQAKISAHRGNLTAVRRQLDAAHAEQVSLAGQLRAGLATAGAAGGPEAPVTPAIVKELTHRHETEQHATQNEIAELTSFEVMTDRFKREAHDQNLCITCARPFATPAEKQAFLQKQEEEMRQVPSYRAKLLEKLERAARELDVLRALQPAALRHDTVAAEVVPELEARVRALEAEAQAAEDELQDAADCTGVAQRDLQEARQLLDDVAAPVDRLYQEIRERTAEVQRLQAETSVTAAERTVADVDNDLEDVEREKARAEGEREEAQRRHNRLRDEVAHLRSESQHAREEVLRLGAAAEKRAAIELQIQELGALNTQLQQQVAEADQARKPLEEKKAALMREREGKRQEQAAREAALEEEQRRLITWDTQLGAKQRAIDDYTSLGKAQALAKVMEALEKQQLRQQQLEAKVVELQAKLRSLEQMKQTHNDTKRQVEDLLAFRRDKKREVELAAQLEGIDLEQAQVGNKAQIEGEFHTLSQHLAGLHSQRDQLRGKMDVIRERVSQCKRDLDVAQYQDIDSKYRMQLVEQRTTEMANSDLDKYHKALEKALLSFHTSKMADINKIVKELWQKTYRNQDIDYIQIKADQEGAAGRSYNYRVVMHTGGAELDMRGRCSAGQKVLACLIIRLALAETFCLNCGILALDEPTTNLDADNSASLAEALRNIMLTRRDQENFQLVVITHDEQFARLIGTREHAEFMWRITKDEAQKSMITQEDIME